MFTGKISSAHSGHFKSIFFSVADLLNDLFLSVYCHKIYFKRKSQHFHEGVIQLLVYENLMFPTSVFYNFEVYNN